jgi:hypothetical protein
MQTQQVPTLSKLFVPSSEARDVLEGTLLVERVETTVVLRRMLLVCRA